MVTQQFIAPEETGHRDPVHFTPDSETALLLRCILLPAIESAQTWRDLSETLARMGFEIVFRDGRLLFRRTDTGEDLCTGGVLGAPLRALAGRLGRPSIRAGTDGHTGRLLI